MADGKSEEAPASSLAMASDRIRASAQYLLGAFAAVGATLAAGLQLADIGDVSFEDDALRAALTVAGLLAAVGGIALAIAAAASVSTESHVDLPWLIANPNSKASKAIDGDQALRQGRAITDLKTEVDTAVANAAKTYGEMVAFGDPGSDADKQRQATTLRNRYDQELATATHLKRIRTDVLDVASYYRTRSAFEAAKGRIVLGALFASLGITAFAWGANAPDVENIDPGEVLPKTPSEVTVILTDEGIDTFGDKLGNDCDTSAISAIAFVVDHTAYEVMTEQTRECESVQLSITDDLGAVVPRVEEDSGDGDDEQSED